MNRGKNKFYLETSEWSSLTREKLKEAADDKIGQVFLYLSLITIMNLTPQV
jgi:hypothetical protein